MLNRLVLSKVLSAFLLAAAVVAQPALTTGPGMELLLQGSGLVLLLVAAFGRTWSSLYIAGRKTSELVTHGPYSIVRHPLYFFSLVGFVGGGLALELVTAGVVFAVIFVVTHGPTMRAEEAKLEKYYGDTYRDYMARVPRLIPRPSQYQDPETVEAYTAKFNRAMIEAALIVLGFLGALIVDASREHGWLPTLWTLI
jgi:protein-S-isoprenylcysteine O-methyltransferase Ste14